jgi:hypothetical protein
MSKKTFTAAPKPKQPSLEEIEAYEKGGAGHDSRPAAPSLVSVTPSPAPVVPVVPNVPDEPAKRLSLDLPATVHTRFKTACSATGRKMVAEIQEFIERRTAELEAEAGLARK